MQMTLSRFTVNSFTERISTILCQISTFIYLHDWLLIHAATAQYRTSFACVWKWESAKSCSCANFACEHYFPDALVILRQGPSRVPANAVGVSLARGSSFLALLLMLLLGAHTLLCRSHAWHHSASEKVANQAMHHGSSPLGAFIYKIILLWLTIRS